jgi:hypothetical protein
VEYGQDVVRGQVQYVDVVGEQGQDVDVVGGVDVVEG